MSYNTFLNSPRTLTISSKLTNSIDRCQVSWLVLNDSNTEVGLSESITLKVKTHQSNYLVHRAFENYQKNKKQKTASVKNRSEVRGGGRKPWKQKGTGRARAGSRTSPLWRGGGVIFGPQPHLVKHKLNKKEYTLAFNSLFFNKKDRLFIFNKKNWYYWLYFIEHIVVKNVNNFNFTKSLIILSNSDLDTVNFFKNRKHFKVILAKNVTFGDILEAQQIFLDRTSFKILKENFCD